MQRCFLIYLFLSSLLSYGQIEIKNFSLIYPDMNLLYVGIENHIEITGIKDTTNLTLTSVTGEVLKFKSHKSNEFLLKQQYTKADTLRLYQAGKLILTKIYEVKSIGYPIAQLGKITDSIATVKEILAEPILCVVIPDCYYDHRFQIISFESLIIQNYDTINIVSVVEPGSIDTVWVTEPEPPYETKPVIETNHETRYDTITIGNKLLPHHINEIKKLKSGDTLVFHEIRAICPDCVTRKLNPIKITIK